MSNVKRSRPLIRLDGSVAVNVRTVCEDGHGRCLLK